jgi:hypothetical protein
LIKQRLSSVVHCRAGATGAIVSTAYSRAHCCTCRAVSTGMHTHLPAAAKELAESSKSLKLAAMPSIGRLCITATLLPVLENGDCAGTVRRGAPDPAYAAPIEHTTFTSLCILAVQLTRPHTRRSTHRGSARLLRDCPRTDRPAQPSGR